MGQESVGLGDRFQAMTFGLSDIESHQRRLFGDVKCTCKGEPHIETCPRSLLSKTDAIVAPATAKKLPKPIEMSRPEREMAMILEAQKRNQEIIDYRFQGMSLAYGEDPETGILLRYKCDFVVIGAPFKIIEVKGHGKHAINAAAKLRFKGAKAAWPMFKFEMWQRQRDGQWIRVL